MALSPMMQEYVKTKEQYKDCILFYRLGDFYEMFFDDALLASRELDGEDSEKAREFFSGLGRHFRDEEIKRCSYFSEMFSSVIVNLKTIQFK